MGIERRRAPVCPWFPQNLKHHHGIFGVIVDLKDHAYSTRGPPSFIQSSQFAMARRMNVYYAVAKKNLPKAVKKEGNL